MEIVFAIVLGSAIGLAVRFLVPQRHTHGIMLVPAAATITTAVVWAVLVWAGFTFDGGWIWVISLTLGGVAALVTALVTPRRRAHADAAFYEHARKGLLGS